MFLYDKSKQKIVKISTLKHALKKSVQKRICVQFLFISTTVVQKSLK